MISDLDFTKYIGSAWNYVRKLGTTRVLNKINKQGAEQGLNDKENYIRGCLPFKYYTTVKK